MYEYISGKVEGLTPTQVVVENAGIGYVINISLHTYAKIEHLKTVKLYIHFVVREDAQLFYGFFEQEERQLYRQLISVNGVGATTAQTMLSSLSPDETQQAILSGNVATLKSIKGIGAKTAQRIILDLQDKIGKTKEDDFKLLLAQDDALYNDAENALISLGFNKKQIHKVLKAILKDSPDINIETLLKTALKQL